jgi:hypothetical protein
MILVGDPRIRKTWRIAFDECECDNPAIDKIIEYLVKGLKDVTMKLRLKLVDDDWVMERSTVVWSFPRDTKDESKIYTNNIYKTTEKIEGVDPLDMMIALSSQLVPSIKGCAFTLNPMF